MAVNATSVALLSEASPTQHDRLVIVWQMSLVNTYVRPVIIYWFDEPINQIVVYSSPGDLIGNGCKSLPSAIIILNINIEIQLGSLVVLQQFLPGFQRYNDFWLLTVDVNIFALIRVYPDIISPAGFLYYEVQRRNVRRNDRVRIIRADVRRPVNYSCTINRPVRIA
ncbi:hypothetical protein ES703_55246 [subsurface metagenome]